MGVDGSWQLEVRSPMGKQHVTVALREEEGKLSGTLTNDANKRTAEIYDGQVAGAEVEWKVNLQEVRMTLAFNTTVDGDSMSGKVKAGRFGRFAVTGHRAAA